MHRETKEAPGVPGL